MDMGHRFLPSNSPCLPAGIPPLLKGGKKGLLRLTGFAKPKKIQLMIDYLITRRLGHFPGPIRNATKIQFDHVPACLADNMVVVILQLTKLIFDR
jgi:hypothetical protein